MLQVPWDESIPSSEAWPKYLRSCNANPVFSGAIANPVFSGAIKSQPLPRHFFDAENVRPLGLVAEGMLGHVDVVERGDVLKADEEGLYTCTNYTNSIQTQCLVHLHQLYTRYTNAMPVHLHQLDTRN